MSAIVEKVDKAPSKKDGPLYEVQHSLYDPQNSIVLETEQVIQTKCERWVARLGSILSEPSNRLPPKYPPSEVLVVRNCIEDADPKAPKTQRPTDASPYLEDGAGESDGPPEDDKVEQSGKRKPFKRRS